MSGRYPLHPLRHRLRRAKQLLLGLAAVACVVSAMADPSTADLWRVVQTQPNIVLVARHTEVGRGVPTLYDPSGQCRNEVMLTAHGRRQAEAMGQAFWDRGIAVDQLQVVASAMCRMRDTAMLAFGKATLDPALRESFSGGGSRQNEFLDAAEGWIKKLRGPTPLVLMTHLPNIDALTGLQPHHGEVIVTEADDSGGLNVLGVVQVIDPARR